MTVSARKHADTHINTQTCFCRGCLADLVLGVLFQPVFLAYYPLQNTLLSCQMICSVGGIKALFGAMKTPLK